MEHLLRLAGDVSNLSCVYYVAMAFVGGLIAVWKNGATFMNQHKWVPSVALFLLFLLVGLDAWVRVDPSLFSTATVAPSEIRTPLADSVQKMWGAEAKIHQVFGAVAENQTMPLDGFEYVNPSFKNVTLIYNGTAPTGGWVSPVKWENVTIGSSNPGIQSMMILEQGTGGPDIMCRDMTIPPVIPSR